MYEYFNLIYWLIAFAALVAWARFATQISRDAHERLVNIPELPWKLMGMGILLVMFLVFVLMPSFWVALPLNLLIAAGGTAAFWRIRVRELGEKGHLFRNFIQSAKGASRAMESRRVNRQVQLSYMYNDDTPIPLPTPESPVAAGLSSADQMIIQALLRRASQVELSPSAGNYDLKLFVDGVSYPQAPLPRPVAEGAIQALKTIGGLSLEERRRPQVGKFKTRDAEGVTTIWSARSSGTTAGERMILVANEHDQWDMRLEQLGMTADQLNDVKKVTEDTQGVVLIASPRHAGRSTTLYALLRLHDAFTNSVQTIETNPQADLEGVTVNRFDTRNPDLSYAKVLSSVFRKDPNVVLSAQCPDATSAETIARFAEEGHRVYVGLPAFDAMAALELWLGLSPDKMLAISALRMIVSQRLVRILCPNCKIPYQPDEGTLRRLNLPVGRNLQSFKANTEPLVDKKGNQILCPDCGGTGFHGRTGIFEVLMITDEMKKALSSNANISQIKAIARKNNMILLVEHGIRKFASGITAINEVTRVLTPEKGTNPSASSGVLPAQK